MAAGSEDAPRSGALRLALETDSVHGYRLVEAGSMSTPRAAQWD